jgi:hypothetical protein
LGGWQRARANRLADRLVDGVLTVTASEHRSQGLSDRSHRPPRCAHQMDPAIEVRVLEGFLGELREPGPRNARIERLVQATISGIAAGLQNTG